MIIRMRGRPKKTDAEKRTNVLRILLTEAERRLLEKTAKAKTLDVSTWARMMLLEMARELTVRTAINRADV